MGEQGLYSMWLTIRTLLETKHISDLQQKTATTTIFKHDDLV